MGPFIRCFIAGLLATTPACSAARSPTTSFVSVAPTDRTPVAPAPDGVDADAEEAARFVSEEGRFSVVFPDTPNESTRPVETDVGEFTIHEIAVDIDTPGHLGAYSVSYSDVPFDPPLMVESTQQGIRTLPRKVVTERTTRVGPQSVEAWEVIFEDGGTEKIARYLQIGRRFYQVIVEYPKETRPTDAESFVQSFEPQ